MVQAPEVLPGTPLVAGARLRSVQNCSIKPHIAESTLGLALTFPALVAAARQRPGRGPDTFAA
jgi:hypothetical protein